MGGLELARKWLAELELLRERLRGSLRGSLSRDPAAEDVYGLHKTLVAHAEASLLDIGREIERTRRRIAELELYCHEVFPCSPWGGRPREDTPG